METVVGLIVVAIVIIGLVASNQSKADNLRKLKEAYNQSLKGTNKRAALEAGRTYYAALRKDKNLTIYDEQAITNDLSTMISEVKHADLNTSN